jgi:hypothetical protein
MYHRTLKELTTLQTRREKQSRDPNHHPSPCPILPREEPPSGNQTPDDADTSTQIAQNKPTEVEAPTPAATPAATPPAPQSPGSDDRSRLASSRSSIAQNKPTIPQPEPHANAPPTGSATS